MYTCIYIYIHICTNRFLDIHIQICIDTDITYIYIYMHIDMEGTHMRKRAQAPCKGGASPLTHIKECSTTHIWIYGDVYI